MRKILEVEVKEVGNWAASNICTFAVSEKKKRLYGSGSGFGSNSIFIVDLNSFKMIGNDSDSTSYIVELKINKYIYAWK